MTYRITFKKSVVKDLKRVDKQKRSYILDEIEKELSSDPYRFPSLKGQYRGLRRMRISKYRVVYSILEDEVLVLRIRHRKSVYR